MMRAENEGYEQAALFEWAEYQAAVMQELQLLYHIPNGGLRSKSEAARMKRQGVKAGVPDLLLPVARGGWHGLYIEMKAEGGRASTEQKKWIAALQEQGYRAEICVGWEAAAKLLTEYLRTGDDGSVTTYARCACCGREIDGKRLRGRMAVMKTKTGSADTEGKMVCDDCMETIVTVQKGIDRKAGTK